jgi:hypothetical protein
LALGQHIVTAEVNFSGLTGGSQLLQMTVTEFSLFVLLVADGLRIRDSLGDGDGFSC